jgi:hypothetical protein
MTIDRRALDDLKSQVDMVALASRYTELKGSPHGEMYGACPLCGAGDDRFHVKGNSWFCRQCSDIARGKGWHDAYEFLKRKEGMDLPEAYTFLGGNMYASQDTQKVTRTTQRAARGHEDPWWVRSSADLVHNASKALSGSPGADYAASRGLTLETLQAFKIGYWDKVPLPGTWDPKRRIYTQPQQPGLVIPWYAKGQLVGLRYRYLQPHTYKRIEGKQNTVKQHSKWKSDFTGVFGSQAMTTGFEHIRTLVICEGELNAMSIWQVANPWKWTVLSVGSEWMDRREHAMRLMSDLGEKAYGTDSPLIGGEKVDANDYLKLGLLAGWLIRARNNACQSPRERERFYYDVQEAHELHEAELDVEGLKAFGELAAAARKEKGN